MKKLLSIMLAAVMLTAIVPCAASAREVAGLEVMSRDKVVEYIEKVNDYWITANRSKVGSSFWERGAYNTGNIEAYMLTGIEAYRQYSEKWANENQWKGNRNSGPKDEWTWGYTGDPNSTGALFGDWQCCFQTFADLYNFDVEKDPNKIARAREVMEYEMRKDNDDFWWWADGLFMVMPAMAKLYLITDNELYLDKLYQYFTYAIELMYDGEHGIPTAGEKYTSTAKLKDGAQPADPNDFKHIFYRDANYVYPRNPLPGDLATTKNFWARGNGWVFAALSKILQDTPDNWEHRQLFLDIYKDYAKAIRDCQKVDDQGRGFWTQSMLAHSYSCSDDNPYGYETSGTAFFTYGFLWGINSGILPEEEYIECALRGWKYLTEVAIQENGKVGYVQWVGGEAGKAAVYDNTQDFAVGATLLAGCEMARYSGGMVGDFYPYLQKRTVATVSLKLGSPYIYSNNKVTEIEAAPFVENNRTFVPLRAIAEALGAKVDWNGDAQEITITKGSRVVKMTIGSTDYTVNGEAKVMDVTPVVVNNRTLVPLRAVGEALGKVVYWNGEKNIVSVGQKENLFYSCEAGMVDMLDGILTTGQIPQWTPKEKDFTPNIPGLRDPAIVRPVNAVSAVEPEDFNSLKMSYDTDPDTRYANNVVGSTVTYDFGDVKKLTKLGIYFWKHDSRTTKFTCEISTDGVNFTKIFDGSSIKNIQVNIFDVNADVRYVRLTNGGNSDNEWFNILEIVGYGEGTDVETNLK